MDKILGYLKLWPAAIGFLVGTWIALQFQSADPDAVERGLSLACAFVGAITGYLVRAGYGAGNRARAALAGGGGLAVCLLIGLAMIAYRWIVR